jgi:hypothetical protein
MYKRIVFISCILLSLIVACKKNNDKTTPVMPKDSTASVLGTWNIKSISVAETTRYSDMVFGDTDSTLFNGIYRMTDITGSIQITADSFYFVNSSYNIDTVFEMWTWQNGIFQDSVTVPLQASPPIASFGFPSIQVSGQDSLSFPNGWPNGALGTSIVITAYGAKYSINGDTMVLKITADSTGSINFSPTPNFYGISVETYTLVKQ